MPQAQLAYGGSPNRLICRFGGATLPNRADVMPTLDLNDAVNWHIDPLKVKVKIDRHLTSSPQAWLARSVWLGDDFWPMSVKFSDVLYVENFAPVGDAKGLLLMAGEQQLTLDGQTYTLAKVRDFDPTPARRSTPLIWRLNLEFLCRIPWFLDMTPTVSAPISVATISSPSQPFATGDRPPAMRRYAPPTPTGMRAPRQGARWPLLLTGPSQVVSPPYVSPTQFTVNYPGRIWAEPVFTVTIPPTNSAPPVSLTLTGTLPAPDEVLTVVFPGGLASGSTWVLTIDTAAMRITDQAGRSYDWSGSFPRLYPAAVPGGVQANPFTLSVTAASGTPAGATVSVTWTNRWSLA